MEEIKHLNKFFVSVHTNRFPFIVNLDILNLWHAAGDKFLRSVPNYINIYIV
jgi:hypothetical protein